jgi:peptidoglycan/LPS O-acetylase OafA/YrhL
VANLLLVHTWLPLPDFLFSGTTVSWSLAAELLFYLLFPAVLPLVKRIPQHRLWLAFGVTVCAVWMVPLVGQALPGPDMVPGVIPLSFPQYWFTYFFPLTRLPEFFLGMLLARLVRGGFSPKIGVVLPGVVTLAVLALAALYLPTPFIFAAATVVPIAFLIAGAASTDLRDVPTVWNRPWAVFLGDIAFAFYLVHYPILLVYRTVFGLPDITNTFALVGIAIVLVGVTTLAAWVIFHFVERPLTQRFGGRRKVLEEAR